MQQPTLLLEGKYEILAKIREGGMGTIYRVRHRLLDEVRVVKVMQPHVVADADLKRRFLEEAKTAIRLKHPNICIIHDFAVEENGTAYLVMEYIDGVNLADLLRLRGSQGVALTLEVAHQALLALGYLHRKGVIHRDVAPDNLMLTHDEEGAPVIKLIDLGIAKTANRSMDMTATGVFLGKLKYASPEQYGTLPTGEKLDGRSDLYGLAVVLYELLTGVRPFLGESPAELLRAHLFSPPTPFSETDKQNKVPAELRAAIFKGLEKKREDRYPTAEDFDREIVGLRARFAHPEDLLQAIALLSTVRSTQPALGDNVTPSAQDRLDRHFGPQTTPSPSLPTLTMAPPSPAEPEDKPAPAAPESGRGAPTAPPGARDTPHSRETEGPAPAPVDQTTINPRMAAERASAAAVTLERKPPAKAAPGRESPSEAARTKAADSAKTTALLKVADPKRVEKEPASSAPAPSRVGASAVGAAGPAASAGKPRGEVTKPPQAPGADAAPAPLRRSRTGLRIGLLLAAVALLLLWHPWARRSEVPEQAATLPTAAAPPPEPTAAPVSSPVPTARPSAAPSPAATPRAATPVPARPFRQAAETARQTMLRARQASEQAHARELAPSTYRRAIARQTEGERLFADSSDGPARSAFEAASRLFSQSEAAAVAAAVPTPVRVAEIPTALVRPSPVPVIPTAVPAPPTAAPIVRLEATRAPVPEREPPSAAVAPPPRANAAEEQRIREMMRSYERAWSTFDAKLYARVYPSGVDAFEMALKNLRSQYVRIEIQRIEFDSSAARANVVGHETIVATPKAGNQVQNESDVTLHLEKRGDHWVIAGRD